MVTPNPRPWVTRCPSPGHILSQTPRWADYLQRSQWPAAPLSSLVDLGNLGVHCWCVTSSDHLVFDRTFTEVENTRMIQSVAMREEEGTTPSSELAECEGDGVCELAQLTTYPFLNTAVR